MQFSAPHFPTTHQGEFVGTSRSSAIFPLRTMYSRDFCFFSSRKRKCNTCAQAPPTGNARNSKPPPPSHRPGRPSPEDQPSLPGRRPQTVDPSSRSHALNLNLGTDPATDQPQPPPRPRHRPTSSSPKPPPQTNPNLPQESPCSLCLRAEKNPKKQLSSQRPKHKTSP